jgi:Zn-dependent protease
MLEWLRSDPVGFVTFMLYRAPAVLIALTLHEIAHGYIALRCGDPTAQMMGRLSLNPLKHLDPIGTLFMFLLGMGWAKPVPVNSRNFKNYRRDDLLVSLAGVTTNFILFIIGTLLSLACVYFVYNSLVINSNGYGTFLTIGLPGFDNLLYGGTSAMIGYMRMPWLSHVLRFLYNFTTVNLGMALFNLLPIPPLDGFHVFNDIILRGKLRLNQQAMRIFMFALIAVTFATNIVGKFLGAAISGVQGAVLHALLAVFGLK